MGSELREAYFETVVMISSPFPQIQLLFQVGHSGNAKAASKPGGRSGTLRASQHGEVTLRHTTHSKPKAFLWFRTVFLAILNTCASHWMLHDVYNPSETIILLICSCDTYTPALTENTRTKNQLRA